MAIDAGALQRAVNDHLAAGNAEGALAALYEAHQQDKRNAAVIYNIAKMLTATGRISEGVHHFRYGLTVDAGVTRLLAAERNPALRMFALQCAALAGERHRAILDPCAFLGFASGDLPDKDEALIAATLTISRQAAQRAAQPRCAEVFARGANLHKREDLKQKRILIACTKYIGCNSENNESDFYYHYFNSAKALGLDVRFFAADDIMYGLTAAEGFSPERFARRAAELRNAVVADGVELVLIPADYLANPRSIGPDFWCSIRNETGCKIVGFMPDAYAPEDCFAEWGDVCDLLIASDINNANYLNSPYKHKTLYVHCPLPLNEKDFADGEKDVDFSFVGKTHRGRDLYLYAAGCAGVSTAIVDSASRRPDGGRHFQDVAAYIDFIRRSRSTFTNGYVSPYKNIITSRCSEAILARSLLFVETGSPIDDFLTPFIHYVPVANVHQFFRFLQYFKKYPQEAERIVAAAADFYQQHYAMEKYWGTILVRCFDGQG